MIEDIYRGVSLGLLIARCINGKFKCYTCVVPLLVLVCHLWVIASCVICSVAYQAWKLLVNLVKSAVRAKIEHVPFLENLMFLYCSFFSYQNPTPLLQLGKNTCSTSVPV